MLNRTLEGKTAIVTGGERGIGRGITERLLAGGMRVCIAGIDTEAAGKFLREAEAGERLLFHRTDVAEEEDVAEMLRATLDAFGHLDAMVANAGNASPGRTPVEKLSLEEWNRYIAVNLTGCFLCAKHAFPELRKTSGSMVLMASTRALQSKPHNTAYSASKGGVIALTHALATSGGPDIRVNCISPGWIHLEHHRAQLREEDHLQHLTGRVGRASDIAAMTAFLLSEEAGFITGQNFVVDGGMTKKMIYQ